MLRKLIKYELKATARVFIFLYVLIAGITGLFAISLGGNAVLENAPDYLEYMLVISAVIMSLVYFGGVCIAAGMAVVRFRGNLLGDEGYIMNTLPVSSKKLIISKLTAAVLWSFATWLVMSLCLLGLAAESLFLASANFKLELGDLFYYISFEDISYLIKEGAWFFIQSFAWLLRLYLMFYASMAIGYSTNKLRKAKSLGVFIVISYLLSFISSIIYRFVNVSVFSVIEKGTFANAGAVAFNIIVAVIMFFVTDWFLKNRLNLQ